MSYTPLQRWYWRKCKGQSLYTCDWDNCPGSHLIVYLPNGQTWDVDSRAVNCSAPWDKQHRCWLRWGELPFITVNKNGGSTCDAGGGSILVRDPNWHGHLRNGNFYEDGWPC